MDEVSSERPHTKTTSSVHRTGNQIQYTLMPLPNSKANARSNPIWISKWTQFPRTVVMGIIARGTGTRLIRCALSTSELVLMLQASEKKLKGINPQRTNTGKSFCELGKILVKTNVNTPIVTRGFRSDHNTPSDILRYRVLKSFWIRLPMTKA